MSKVAIIGAGAWGTALSLQAIRAGHHVALIARDEATASAVKASRENRRLPGYRLPDSLEVRHNLPSDADLLLWAIPTQHLRSSLLRLQPADGAIVVCAKGVEAKTGLLPLEVASEVSPSRPLAILTGPNFAHEVARGLPAAAVVASVNAGLREQVRAMLGTSTFRLYGNDDPIGAQLGGAAKNVIAIAAGAVIGAGLGENARAALVTRGLSELRRLGVALGGRAETVMGLSGLGDLLLTCTGPSSRNFSLGYALGRGAILSNILASRSEVTEGVLTAAALVARAGEIELPICRAVAELLAGVKTLDQAITQLLSRPQRDE
ncbi:NAD(P)H-dependent glycerol-3-phosphate dehydrogenase [Acidisphaera sp. S103]|uniref:NAD(P)H-dependent glycerol-3-phosphate dehydrogenase n=1 Tax=Acidisphaera sp. S103 TaxID=1747223 RepID=UPI00131E2621|nr:NAD(P)H-dependent glycerol-3-phosphate dehydrogenase [Acidisphaera sp. S103]